MNPGLRLLAALLVGIAAALPWPTSRYVAVGRPLPRGSGSARAPAASPDEITIGEVAATCDLVALALQSGAGVDVTLLEVADSSAPGVAAALHAIVAARKWNIDPGASAIGGSAWAPLVRAVRLADAAGVPPAAAIRGVATDLRSRRQHRLELATARLRVQVVLPLGLCFLPAFVLTTVIPVILALAVRVSAP